MPHGFDENMASNIHSPTSKKRKRSSADGPTPDSIGPKRTSLSHTNGNSENVNGNLDPYPDSPQHEFANHISRDSGDQDISTTAAAALTAHLNNPEDHNLSFVSANSTSDDRRLDESFGMGETQQPTQGTSYSLAHYSGSGTMTQGSANGHNKPAVGTDEWHKVRKDNHKEVERRRRETINEGINELAKIVPNCEKNKGAVLARAVVYINELKEREETAGQKKVLEKVILEQAVQELTSRNEDLQSELRRSHRELDALRKRFKINENGSLQEPDQDRGTE